MDANEAIYFLLFLFMANPSPTSPAQARIVPAPAPANAAGTTHTIALGVPYKDSVSERNSKIVLDAVKARFPDWADQCQPYINVLPLRAWNERGYRVKKGEKAICVMTQAPVTEKDEKSGEDKVVGSRPARAHVFALPQVAKRA